MFSKLAIFIDSWKPSSDRRDEASRKEKNGWTSEGKAEKRATQLKHALRQALLHDLSGKTSLCDIIVRVADQCQTSHHGQVRPNSTAHRSTP